MMGGLKPYPQMKDSGVPWLGEVPEHWEVQTVGRLGQLFKGNGGSKADEVDVGVPCVRYGDLYTRHEFFITKTKACITPDRASAYTPIRFGDLLFAASGETDEDIGRSAVNLLQVDARCGGDVLVLRPFREFVPSFLGYAADSWASRIQKTTMGRGFTVVHIYGTQLKHLALTIPPLTEQAAIVRFLDHADRRIRRYIRAKQKLIKLLEEQKQAFIHRAVTRGLDPNVRLKPSGVEWLGDVPEHWDVTPLSRVLMQRKEKNDPSKTTNILSLSLKTGVIPYAEKEPGGNKPKEDLSAYMLAYPGDIVVNSMNVVVGSVGLSKYFGAVSPVYYMLRPRDPVDAVEYFSAVFRDVGFQRSLFGLGNGIMYIESKSSGKLNTIRLRIPMTRLKRLLLPRPPSPEQDAIVRHLGEITAGVATTLSRTEREIDLLREYRTRLIADVVTGKLDVREAAARLPLESEDLEPLDEAEALGEADDESAADDLDPEPQEAEE